MTQPLALIPEPRTLELGSGHSTIAGSHGFSSSIDASLPREGYLLDIDDAGVRLRGGSEAGVFYGEQTLLQLLPPGRAARARGSFRAALDDGPVELPRLHLEDEPALPWRGFMLDVVRHFFPVEFVLRVIDQLAAHKLNVLHLHLTDDQGWRIPIPGYPLLTEVGAWRAESPVGYDHEGDVLERDGLRHGGAYTRAELEQIVAYARERFIEVVPEIDLPGHVSAAIAAYPSLGNGDTAQVRTRWGISEQILNLDDDTLRFVADVLAEVAAIFPNAWVHAGGDEVPKREWRESAAIQAKIRELGLADESALQGWFTDRVIAMLRSHDRGLVAWDEVVDSGASRDTLVMAWRSREHGVRAVEAGYDVVMSASDFVYLDHRQSGHEAEPVTFPGSPITLEQVFSFEPLLSPSEGGTDHGTVRGAQAHLWTEYVPTPEHAEYMMFPRLCAFAEVAWRPALVPDGRRDFAGFLDRLRHHVERLRAAGVAFRSIDREPDELRDGPLPLRG